MKIVCAQKKIVSQILPKQNIDDKANYRKFFYLIEHPVDGGYLFANTLTYEILFLTENETKIFNNPDINNPDVRHLIEGYFLVPENFDDKKLGLQVMNTRLQIQNIPKNPPFSYFVILPTTGCNARCFYCFEKGAKVSNMTEQTAHDVADFVKRKGAKKVNILWFGGEPLINTKAIDIISQDLNDKNVNFTSSITTNGYLLDEETIQKAVNLWKVKKIQISLDGTEEVYNKVKDYVYKDVSSPFKKVLQNIEDCLNAGIRVHIRLNMDEHNADDLFELSKLLVQKFNEFNNCHIYVVKLYEGTCGELQNKTIIDRHKLIETGNKLQSFIDTNMPPYDGDEMPSSSSEPNTCMACSDSSTMIVPDGHLGKCEHYVDSDFYGSIYSDDYDMSKFNKYKERTTVGPECDDCEMRSLCLHVKLCKAVPDYCDEVCKASLKARFESKLDNIYNVFLKLEKKNNG